MAETLLTHEGKGEPLRHVLAESLDARSMAIAIYALYLGAFVTGGLSALAGLVILYIVRDDADALLHSHFTFQMRTFWIGLAAGGLGVVLLPAMGLGLLVLVAAAIWFMVRAVAGASHLLNNQSYPQPNSWLI